MSWIEVEAKVKVSDVKDARVKIKKIAKFVKKEKKVDDYYSLERRRYPKKSLRVRDEGKKRVVNYKGRRKYFKGIWAKEEVEFEVSDLKNFFNLIADFGFRKWLRKTKNTELYRTKDGVHIELNFVRDMGWFIEIEVLCDDDPKKIRNARKRIHEIMKDLNVRKRFVIKKGYTKLLWAMKHY